MRIEQTSNVYTQHYDSAVDLDHALTTLQPRTDGADAIRQRLQQNKINDVANYGGIRTVKEARKLVVKGWPEGASRIKGLAEQIKDKIQRPTSIRRRMVWDEQGDELELSKVYSGELDSAWRNPRRTASYAPPVITLYLPWGGNWSEFPEELFWKSAPALAVADALESCGYRVELIAVSRASQPRDTDAVTMVTVKPADTPVDLGTLAAVCCHAGIYRTLGFATILHHPAYVSASLGSWEPIEPICNAPSSYTLSSSVYDEQTAIAECNRILAKRRV